MYIPATCILIGLLYVPWAYPFVSQAQYRDGSLWAPSPRQASHNSKFTPSYFSSISAALTTLHPLYSGDFSDMTFETLTSEDEDAMR